MGDEGGGGSWRRLLVLVASTGCQLVVNVWQLSFFSLLQAFLHHKDIAHAPDTSQLSLLSSVVFFTSICMHGVVLHRSNVSKLTICSSLLSFLAIFVGSFSKNVDYFVLSLNMLAGVGLSGLYLTSIAALSFTFTSHFSLVLGVMLCVSKASHFLHEPLTELLVSTFRWDGTCQIMAACCLNGLVCGLLFGAPNNIESLALEWLFYWPSFESSNDSKGPSEVKDFKNSFVVQSILRVKEKQKDHSNKSLDGCILTNSNNLLRPPSDTQLADTHQQQRPSLPSSLQSSSISFSCSSHSSLQSYFHTETFQEFPSTFQYEAVPQKPPLQKASLQKTSILKTAPNPSKQLLCNYKQIFKCPSFFLFNASFALAYTGLFLASSFLLRRLMLRGSSLEDMHFIYFLSLSSETLNCLSAGLLLQSNRLPLTTSFSVLLLLTGLLVLSLVCSSHPSFLTLFTLFFGFCKAAQTILRAVFLRSVYGPEAFAQTFSISHFFEAVATTLATLMAGYFKRHAVLLEWVFASAGGCLLIAMVTSIFIGRARRKENEEEEEDDDCDIKGPQPVDI